MRPYPPLVTIPPMAPVSESDQVFLAHRKARRGVGLYGLPLGLVGLILAWAGLYVFWPLAINPAHAIGAFEGVTVEPGTLTMYAVTAAVLMNVVFALLVATLVLGLVWASRERRYWKLLEQRDEKKPTQL